MPIVPLPPQRGQVFRPISRGRVIGALGLARKGISLGTLPFPWHSGQRDTTVIFSRGGLFLSSLAIVFFVISPCFSEVEPGDAAEHQGRCRRNQGDGHRGVIPETLGKEHNQEVRGRVKQPEVVGEAEDMEPVKEVVKVEECGQPGGQHQEQRQDAAGYHRPGQAAAKAQPVQDETDTDIREGVAQRPQQHHVGSTM